MVVAEARVQAVPLEIRAIGNVEAYARVEIKSQVAGELTRVAFREGDEVKQGQLLFEIDPREYRQAVVEAEAQIASQRAAVGQAEANHERDVAQARTARDQANRFANLAAKGIISRQQNEDAQTQAVAAEKAAVASKANIENARAALQGAESRTAEARLRLGYTRIASPMTGRTGYLAYKEGNLIQANMNPPLVVINKISPVYVTFSIPEVDFNELRRFWNRGGMKVSATPKQAAGPAAEGSLEIVDNQVDATTGTILLKARFANQNRQLWPGEFVNVSVQLTTENVTVVPTAAVKNAQQGNYVFVVKPDSTAEQRTVKSPRAYQDISVIASGVKPGERVIVEGQLRVKPGIKVQVREGGAQQQASTQDAAGAAPGQQ